MNIIQIKETCLYVADLDRSIEFYHRKLGLPLISQVEGRHVFFRAGSSVLLCFIAEVTKADQNLPPHFGYGNQHLAFEVSREEYASWLQRLKDEDIPVIHEQEWKPNVHSFYFRDPDENLLEIVPEGMWD